jgi:ferredoxin
MNTARADLYHYLAECMLDPPAWLSLPGNEWPLTAACRQLEKISPAAKRGARRLAEIEVEGLAGRRARYAALFLGPGQPRLWLSESAYLSGCMFGPEGERLERIYRMVGLSIHGPELPDHACHQLAFLAHLAKLQLREPDMADKWLQVEGCFIQQHPGRWLPQLGRNLAACDDEVYAPLGDLLADWLEESLVLTSAQGERKPTTQIPVLPIAEKCVLCGFCTQVCRMGTLAIHESVNDTYLVRGTRCDGCLRCVQYCPTQAISMRQVLPGETVEKSILKISARIKCPCCGRGTVSQAEMSYIAEKIGNMGWLGYCPECKGMREEVSL